METSPPISIYNPAAVEVPEFRGLIEAAFSSSHFPPLGVMISEVRSLILDTRFSRVIVKPWTTLAILALPSGPFIDIPQMVHFYNRGSQSDKREVLEYAVDILKTEGYNQVLALNQSGKSDKVWARALTPKGWTASHKASLYEFRSEG